jgi:hypothetical protein
MEISQVKVAQAQSARQAQRTEETQRASARQAEQQAAETRKAQQPESKPVVNTQGQTTGRLLNVTA